LVFQRLQIIPATYADHPFPSVNLSLREKQISVMDKSQLM
jgi:hypothetical protein